MAIGIITGIIIVGLMIGAFAFAAVSFDNAENGKGVAGTLIGLILVLALIVVPFSFHTVQTGEIAVVKHLGKAKEIKEAGLHYDFWMTNKY